MSDFIKQKQIENLVNDLGNKANSGDVLLKASNLNDLANKATSRTNLDVHSKAEVNALLAGAENGISVATIAARAALTNLKVSDRVFVSNDGDGKWAMYIVTAVTTGSGSTSTFEKVADKDIFDNAMSAAAVKSSYESNANTNAFTDAEKAKVNHILVTQAVNLDTMESAVNSNTGNITTAQNTANSAQTTANNALNVANSKQAGFTEAVETFSGLTEAKDTDINLDVSNPVRAGHEVLVFFGAVRVSNVNWSPGNPTITINVPYATEPTDEIYIYFKY